MPQATPQGKGKPQKKTASISFEISVLDDAKAKAANEGLPFSIYVNRAIKRELKLKTAPKE